MLPIFLALSLLAFCVALRKLRSISSSLFKEHERQVWDFDGVSPENSLKKEVLENLTAGIVDLEKFRKQKADIAPEEISFRDASLAKRAVMKGFLARYLQFTEGPIVLLLAITSMFAGLVYSVNDVAILQYILAAAYVVSLREVAASMENEWQFFKNIMKLEKMEKQYPMKEHGFSIFHFYKN